jgi:hypothetical protein
MYRGSSVVRAAPGRPGVLHPFSPHVETAVSLHNLPLEVSDAIVGMAENDLHMKAHISAIKGRNPSFQRLEDTPPARNTDLNAEVMAAIAQQLDLLCSREAMVKRCACAC